MTNNQIIFSESTRLAEEGVLKYTGRVFQLEDGSTFKEVEPIHTFAAWKEAGYSVKKGEKAIAAFPIWKHTAARTVKTKDGETIEKPARMFLKTAYFFTAAQVEPMKKRA